MQVIPLDLYEVIEELDPKVKLAFMRLLKFMHNIVTKEDFLELKNEVDRLSSNVAELSEAVKRLAEAQEETQKELKELAKAQEETKKELRELAEAQKRTETELQKLAHEHKITREQLGGLFHTVGYIFEDGAYHGLPELLKRDFGIEVFIPLRRKKFKVKGRWVEINILGKGKKDSQEIWIIGEAKSRLEKKHVDAFLLKSHLFEKLFPGEKIYVMVTYMDVADTCEYAQAKNIKVYYSYDLPL